jgi:hypothetical protein
MTVRLLPAWRRLMLPASIALAAAGWLGCRTDMGSWRRTLAAEKAERLVGLWEVRLQREGDDRSQPSESRGSIGLTLNEEHLPAPGFDAPPMVFGSYDIDFARVGLHAGTSGGVPGVVGMIRGDSVDLQLAPDAELPIELRGVLTGDTVVGRWAAHRRAGIDAIGEFVLRRRVTP